MLSNDIYVAFIH